jgi:ATP-dependent protease HslVU (ClpYQ) peptidase subunit
MSQVLQYGWSAPSRAVGCDLMKYMCTVFVDSIRDSLKDAGFARDEKGEEIGGNFLVAYDNELFQIESDYQVGRTINSYAAIGSGYSYALGSIFTSEEDDSETRIKIALAAAANFNTTVRAPFTVKKA